MKLRLYLLIAVALVALTVLGCSFHVPIPKLMVVLLVH